MTKKSYLAQWRYEARFTGLLGKSRLIHAIISWTRLIDVDGYRLARGAAILPIPTSGGFAPVFREHLLASLISNRIACRFGEVIPTTLLAIPEANLRSTSMGLTFWLGRASALLFTSQGEQSWGGSGVGSAESSLSVTAKPRTALNARAKIARRRSCMLSKSPIGISVALNSVLGTAFERVLQMGYRGAEVLQGGWKAEAGSGLGGEGCSAYFSQTCFLNFMFFS